jgi:peptidoglycan/LPS O-acetylase OafA/YrhL
LNPSSPFPVIACLLLALATCHLLTLRFGKPQALGRYLSIDGLRGVLALSVFIHHASIWYFFSQSGGWKLPPSRLYVHLGQSSVLLFFMITGFLFFGKLLDSRNKEIDWLRLFISRLLRLAPLYFFSMLLLFILVAQASGGIRHEALPRIMIECMKWLAFTVNGAPDINQVENTALMIAGVTWTLKHEWLFYLSLPFIAIFTRKLAPLPYMVVGVAAYAYWHPHGYILLSFLGGILASVLVRSPLFCRMAASPKASLLVLAALVLAAYLYPSSHGTAPVLLLATAFSLIAGGNSLFGLLTHHATRTLGEMAYSIYLLHGILLFISFKYILRPAGALPLDPLNHWLAILVLTPTLVCISFLTFSMIEKPALKRTPALTEWLRIKFGQTASKLI